MRRYPMLAVMFFVLSVAPLGGGDGHERALNQADKDAVVEGNTGFALELYAELMREKGNLFFSPFSISNALALLYAGASGSTAEQMADTLHFAALQPSSLHPAFGTLTGELSGKGKKRNYQLCIANALWGREGNPFLVSFDNLTRDLYGAELHNLNFAQSPELARQAINAWVEKQTQNKIKELLKPNSLDANTRLVLTNAIYFKAPWFRAFDEKDTKKADFRVTLTRTQTALLMHQTHTFGFLDQDTFQALELPYKSGDLRMVVFLPKKVDGLADFERALTPAKLEEWLTKLEVQDVDVALPKFKVTEEVVLNRVLAALGMPLAFSEEADFSAMSRSEKLSLTAVIHKAFIAVDEKGTEAAAATGINIGPTSIGERQPRPCFRADHPFVFLIKDARTGSILFLGRVATVE